jgi:hypothetical protein
MARSKAKTSSTRTSKVAIPGPKARRKAAPPARKKAAAPKSNAKTPVKTVSREAKAERKTTVVKARPPKVAASPKRPVGRRLRAKVAAEAPASLAPWPDVGEQERVGALKFGAPPASHGFDEQRFLFPRNYEVNRVRLVVRDPEWLFAYWDVNPRAFDGIRREMGERAMALSRLTLKVADPEGGHAQIILLPYGARSWYVRIDPSHRRYFAELGITLPSGQFRPLAQSNVVAVPRVGASPDAAQRSVNFREAWAAVGDIATGVGDAPSAALSEWIDPGTSIRPGPGPQDLSGASDRLSAEMAGRRGDAGRAEPKGGASDLFRR